MSSPLGSTTMSSSTDTAPTVAGTGIISVGGFSTNFRNIMDRIQASIPKLNAKNWRDWRWVFETLLTSYGLWGAMTPGGAATAEERMVAMSILLSSVEFDQLTYLQRATDPALAWQNLVRSKEQGQRPTCGGGGDGNHQQASGRRRIRRGLHAAYRQQLSPTCWTSLLL